MALRDLLVGMAVLVFVNALLVEGFHGLGGAPHTTKKAGGKGGRGETIVKLKAVQGDNADARMQRLFKHVGLAVVAGTGFFGTSPDQWAAHADTKQGDFKIGRGAASTLDSGTVKIITRGVTLDGSDFAGKDLTGVSFQQSLVRLSNFKGAKLESASFFDADVAGANFEGADLRLANLESSNLKDANLKNAIVVEAYVSGTTKFIGVNIEGADFTDTPIRKDQLKYLCERASGTNPTTGVATRDSLGCP